MSVATSGACARRPLPTDGRSRRRRWATTWARSLDHCADMNGAPLTRTPPRRSWGRGPSPPGWRRIQARRSTCLLLRALQRRRVESLVLGALSSSPVHRALVLVLGTNIAVLLDCSKSSRQCSLYYLLTYLPVVSVLCCSTHGLYPFILLMHSLASFSRISYFRLGFVLVRAEHGPEICDGIGQGGLLQY